ncbi:uncharacterized protein [Eurosta solidaginis]|uniref:uncharacterized protein n=1 Tax=Eurosta solidaginis TaxID=178769 RepID=UPI0035315695
MMPSVERTKSIMLRKIKRRATLLNKSYFGLSSLPALWNVMLEEYSNRDERAKQYETLLEFYKKRYPNATVDNVKRKINTLRSNFRREKQRLAKSSRSGAASDDSQEPSLFYYYEMQFLNDMDTPCSSKGKRASTKLLKRTLEKAAKRKPDAAETLVEIASKRVGPKEKSYSEAITYLWAVKLDRMTPQQRILCEKFVADILFEGQMGTLHRNSLQINAGEPFPNPVAINRINSTTI